MTVVWPADRGEWVTWEECPYCGDRAAVSWVEAGPFVDAVEFDCSNGCRRDIREFARIFPPRERGQSAASWGSSIRPILVQQ
ncbi:hypothetical protein [Blastococcus sp. TF02A-26]|uniref:hypothetical protein n=1 Tax=Blastococcus sp. TF02A-26 TaxID=2250577 RepID=UPI0011BEBA9F|nr:hypothetical protein [Blastococcus sp. TF02A-26]